MKTVRFTQIVKQSGRPEVHAFWAPPEKDAEFARARKANRVMTVEHASDGKADVANVGYEPPRRGREYLVFPKSLAPFTGARVVGIKFALVSHSSALATAHRGPSHQERKSLEQAARADHKNSQPSQLKRSDAWNRSDVASPSRRRAKKPPLRFERKSDSNESPSLELERAVRTALGELRSGETTAAYERLQRALARARSQNRESLRR